MYVNPSSFCNQFREELIRELGLMEQLCCPLCIITYVDVYQEGCCGPEGCVFEYAEPLENVVRYWKEAVLKEMARMEDDGTLLAKWKGLLGN